MRLVTFTHKGHTRIGALVDEFVVDLSVAAPELPAEMVAFLEAGIEAMVIAKDAIASGAGRIRSSEGVRTLGRDRSHGRRQKSVEERCRRRNR